MLMILSLSPSYNLCKKFLCNSIIDFVIATVWCLTAHTNVHSVMQLMLRIDIPVYTTDVW